MLIKPMSLLDHLERGEGLFGLIVIVEVPGNIRDGEEHKRQRRDAPKQRPRV
jgi:hypothetical protein